MTEELDLSSTHFTCDHCGKQVESKSFDATNK